MKTLISKLKAKDFYELQEEVKKALISGK